MEEYCVDTTMLVVSNVINILIVVALFVCLGILLKRTAQNRKDKKKEESGLDILD